jgi:hypothetical protein
MLIFCCRGLYSTVRGVLPAWFCGSAIKRLKEYGYMDIKQDIDV